MDIIHAPGTEQFSIDRTALTAFLQKARFAQSYIDDLNMILLPVASDSEVDDDDWEVYGSAFVDVWLYCKDATVETLNRQLLLGLRRSCYEEDQQESTAQCLANWGLDPKTMTDDQIEADIVGFADWYSEAQLITVKEVNHFCHTLYFRTRKRAELARAAFAKVPLQVVVTTIEGSPAVQIPTIGVMKQKNIDEILRAMRPVRSSFNVPLRAQGVQQ
jgi:hypothetical protein